MFSCKESSQKKKKETKKEDAVWNLGGLLGRTFISNGPYQYDVGD